MRAGDLTMTTRKMKKVEEDSVLCLCWIWGNITKCTQSFRICSDGKMSSHKIRIVSSILQNQWFNSVVLYHLYFSSYVAELSFFIFISTVCNWSFILSPVFHGRRLPSFFSLPQAPSHLHNFRHGAEARLDKIILKKQLNACLYAHCREGFFKAGS